MNAGCELDADVAEKVMGGAAMGGFLCPDCGCTWFGTVSNGDRVCHDDGCHWSGSPSAAVPAYSTDIAAAWTVVERLQVLGRHNDRDIRAALSIANCYTAPHVAAAICRAALAAVGAEVPA